jgi:hypothetical protein
VASALRGPPLLLFTLREDHVVEPSHSEHLAATYGGPVHHRWLERSYHVATMDCDGDVIAVEGAAFARKVTRAGACRPGGSDSARRRLSCRRVCAATVPAECGRPRSGVAAASIVGPEPV